MFLGDDLLAWLVLALGAAMAAGNLAALVRPRRPAAGRHARNRARRGSDRSDRDDRSGAESTDLERPPLARSLLYVVVGLSAALWALATLVSR